MIKLAIHHNQAGRDKMSVLTVIMPAFAVEVLSWINLTS
ncbi:hypothetical Protein YC6258_00930 [Gynuella sunshinyii YC6258]|uniref:Uncharacterized protein n=1 Tax=Gynuella sunshinyii YC6258 TaxID=1445510 RepID=A0A0C5V085_9GAMM|nr:hypothetical Protein YC6258_00930 [Gynuella sunshinyii YC6258]